MTIYIAQVIIIHAPSQNIASSLYNWFCISLTKFYWFSSRHTTNITLLFTINNICYLYFLYKVFCKIFWDRRIIVLTFVLNLSLIELVLTKFKIYNGCDRKWKTSYWILFFIFEKILNTNLSSPCLNQKRKAKKYKSCQYWFNFVPSIRIVIYSHKK